MSYLAVTSLVLESYTGLHVHDPLLSQQGLGGLPLHTSRALYECVYELHLSTGTSQLLMSVSAIV